MSAPTKKPKSPLPYPPLLAQWVEGAVEPLVLAAPPAGRSGALRVSKALHDALGEDPHLVGPHVFRIRAFFNQHMNGRRSVNVRLDLNEDFPNLPLETLPERLHPLLLAGAARARSVLGPDFLVMPVALGGKKLR